MSSTRRDLLGRIGIVAAVGVGRALISDNAQRFVLRTCYVADFQHHDGLAILPTIDVGDPVALVAEPTNPHDPLAVRIDHAGRPIGYVPRTENETICRLLQQGAPLSARIIKADPHAPLWEAVKVEVAVVV